MSMRVAAVGSREDPDTYVAALTTSADMSGLTEVVTRWSAAKPAVTSCEEIVTLPELTGESRDRSRGMHVSIAKPQRACNGWALLQTLRRTGVRIISAFLGS
jgi:hypothetical protein